MSKTMTYFIITIAFTITSFAGVKLEYNHYEGGDKSNATVNTIIMSDTEMMIEDNSPEGRVTMLYNSVNDRITILTHSSKKYMTISKEKLDNMKKQINSMMSQMEQQLANLPDAQRKQMEKLLSQQMGGISNTEYNLSKTGNAKKINGWNTNKYELKADGSTISEIWAANFDELKIKSSDFKIMKKFTEFSATMTEAMPSSPKNAYSAIFEEFEGFPVKTIESRTNSTTELKSIDSFNGNIDFKIPSDYSEKSIKLPGSR